jgi:hypothetical protein
VNAKTTSCLSCLFVLLSLINSACGQCATQPTTAPDFPLATHDRSEQVNLPRPRPFSAGTWGMQLTASYISELSHGQREQLWAPSVGISAYVADRLAITGELPIYFIDQQAGDAAVAAGFNLLLRYHFYERGPLSFFIDGGAGVFVGDKRVPRDGTNFNFTPQVGLGVTYYLGDSVYLIGGARAWHLSNAGIRGNPRNPSVDFAIQTYMGVTVFF